MRQILLKIINQLKKKLIFIGTKEVIFLNNILILNNMEDNTPLGSE